MKRVSLALLTALAFLFLMYVSVTVNAKDVFTQDVVSLIMPADYAFSIWGLIYLGLFILIVSQFFVSPKVSQFFQQLSLPLTLALVATASSLIVPTSYQPLAIGSGVLFLSVVYVLTNTIKDDVTTSDHEGLYTAWLWVRRLITVYLGWMSVALILNISTALKEAGFVNLFGLTELMWAMIMLVVGGGLAILVTQREREPLYGLVFVWAYVAIALNETSGLVVILAALAMIVVIAFFLEIPKRTS